MHPAHINFFKNSMYSLKNAGHNVFVTVLKRGKLPKIVESELDGFNIKIIGQHKGTKSSIIFDANLFRFLKMFSYLRKIKPDVGVSVGSFILGANLKILNKPNYQFDDDPERSVNVFLEKLTSTKLFFPNIYFSNSSKVELVNTLKEWAYLSPKYFRPNKSILYKYKLKPFEYIFVREISTGSLNYSTQQSNIIASFSDQFPKGTNVLFSLENKENSSLYPNDWILLKEPVSDIHSLIFFSKLLISSGDSMAREGALLGVPSIYCGNRTMRANKLLEEKKVLFHQQIGIPNKIKEICDSDVLIDNRNNFRNVLYDEWIDINEFIVELVKKSEY